MATNSSRGPNDCGHHGCMHGLLHFLDFNQRLRIRKRLPYKRSCEGKLARKTKSPKDKPNVSPAGEGHESMHQDAESLVGDEASESKQGSGKGIIQDSEGSSREHNHKQNISPLASRLRRTISIHHLQSSDYADLLALNSEDPNAEHNSYDHGSLTNRGHESLSPKASDELTSRKSCEVCGTSNNIDFVGETQHDGFSNHLLEKQSLLKEKLNDAKEALSKQKSTDAKDLGEDVASHQSKELLDMMKLLNANRGLLLAILQDPSIIANYLHSQQSFSAERVMCRSRSFPVTGLLSRNNSGPSRLKHKPTESEDLVRRYEDFQAKASSPNPNMNDNGESEAGGGLRSLRPEPTATHGVSSSLNALPSSSESNDLRDNQEGNQTASSHFKVIKRRIKDVIKGNKKEGHRISMDGVLHRIPYGRKLSQDEKRGKQGLWEAPSSAKYDRGKSRSKMIKRSHSLTESLDKYSHLLEQISSRQYKKLPQRLKSKKESGDDSQGMESQKSLGRIFSLPNFEPCSLGKDVPKVAFNAAQSLKIPAVVNIYDSKELDTEDNLESDLFSRNPIEVDAIRTLYGGEDQQKLTDEQEMSESWNGSKKSSIEGNIHSLLYEQESRDVEDCSHEPTKPRPVLDLSPDDHVSAMNFSGSEALKLSPILFELDSSTNPESWLYGDASEGQGGSEAEFDRLPTSSELDDFSPLQFQVDQKDEAEFNYVRDILQKSGFGGNEFLEAWYAPDQPVDPLLFEEAECCPSHEIDISGDESIVSLEHQLLFDLMNEVIFEIYENSFACCPWLSCFDSRVRPVPMGNHILEEVWANISWYHRSQPQLNLTLDDIVARDFTKKDGWMDLIYDAEHVGLELEDLIVDDLLDEVVLELKNS